jgi:hypothetical protein
MAFIYNDKKFNTIYQVNTHQRPIIQIKHIWNQTGWHVELHGKIHQIWQIAYRAFFFYMVISLLYSAVTDTVEFHYAKRTSLSF